MHVHPHLAAALHEARARELHREAAIARLGRRPVSRPARPAARQRLGRSLVRLGTRLAGDPTYRPARSR